MAPSVLDIAAAAALKRSAACVVSPTRAGQDAAAAKRQRSLADLPDDLIDAGSGHYPDYDATVNMMLMDANDDNDGGNATTTTAATSPDAMAVSPVRRPSTSHHHHHHLLHRPIPPQHAPETTTRAQPIVSDGGSIRGENVHFGYAYTVQRSPYGHILIVPNSSDTQSKS